MTVVMCICVGVLFAVSVYMMLGRELKGVAMGVFLIGHAANLSILAMSGSPVLKDQTSELRAAPILDATIDTNAALEQIVDPLPQALILTAIVIGFAVMGFLLTLLVRTGQTVESLVVSELSSESLRTSGLTDPDGSAVTLSDDESNPDAASARGAE